MQGLGTRIIIPFCQFESQLRCNFAQSSSLYRYVVVQFYPWFKIYFPLV